jgi:hypothetical protein
MDKISEFIEHALAHYRNPYHETNQGIYKVVKEKVKNDSLRLLAYAADENNPPSHREAAIRLTTEI